MRYFVIHASATYPSMDIGVTDINDWHLARGWNGIGYHYVIRRDGTLEKGRDETTTGAHVGGHNTGTLGICMAGGLKQGTEEPEDNFLPAQWITLNKLLADLTSRYGKTPIVGHNFFPNHKSRGCPCFDWKAYAEWFEQSQKALHAPMDWYDYNKYDWHTHSTAEFQLPKSFYDEVDAEPKQ